MGAKPCRNLTPKAIFFDYLEIKFSLFNKSPKTCLQNFSHNSTKIIMIIVAFFLQKIYKKKKIVIIFFSIIPPNLAQIIILLFFTKHMAYNINFCEGNLEAAPARFWCSLKTKNKTKPLLFAHLQPQL